MVTKIYLTRHGQTKWNVEGRLQGSQNSDLTDEGKRQAHKLRDRLSHIDLDVIYSSTSGRAVETAAILNTKDIPVLLSDQVVEMAFGHWEGMHIEEVKSASPEAFDALFNKAESYIPVSETGETFDALMKRAGTFINKVVEKHPGESVLVVSHGITTKALLVAAENRGLDTFWEGPFIQGCSLSLIEVKNQGTSPEPRVILHGDTEHL